MKRQQMTLRLRLTFCIVIMGTFLTGCVPNKAVLATQTAIAATATFEALPTATLTRTPTAIPTLTLTPSKTPTKSPTPKPTRTERPTATPDKMREIENWGPNWIDKFFIPTEKQQELRDTGAIIISDFPEEQFKNLKFTKPGQAYIACSGKRIKMAFRNQYLTQIMVDRVHYGPKICAYKAATEQEIRAYNQTLDPSASPERIQQLTLKYIQNSQAMTQMMPDGFFYLDAYLTLSLSYNINNPDDISWKLFGSPNGDGELSSWIKSLFVPIP